MEQSKLSPPDLLRAQERIEQLAAGLPLTTHLTSIGAVMEPDRGLVRAHLEVLSADQVFLYFVLRTTSWDFGGERTDLHDVLSLALAALLSRSGVASFQLIDEVNPALPWHEEEIYARLLVPRQPSAIVDLTSADALPNRLFSVWAVESVLLRHLHEPEDCPCEDGAGRPLLRADPEWEAAALRALRRRPSPRLFVSRRAWPSWQYLHVPRNATTVACCPQIVELLDVAGTPERPVTEVAEEGRFVHTEDLRHFVPATVVRRARQVLRGLDDLPVGDDQPTLVALEDRVIALGCDHLVSLPADSGANAYRAAAAQSQERLRRRFAFFKADAHFAWADPIPPERFEDLVRELLESSGTVAWLRQVGATRERDRGRDFMAEWVAVTPSDAIALGTSPQVRLRVIVQAKASSRPVNASDVPGIVDTIEEHDADGFFLAVASRITAPLADRLESLRQRGRYSVIDWWTRSELEAELRRAPDVLARFRDVVREA